jgi:hypothetical protein
VNVLEVLDELPLAHAGSRQFLHPPLRRREKGRGEKGRIVGQHGRP